MKEESFGPVIGIMKVKNDDEAIESMKDTEYGLTASVYSSDQKHAEKFYSRSMQVRVTGIAAIVLVLRSLEWEKTFWIWSYTFSYRAQSVYKTKGVSPERLISMPK